MLLSVRDLSVAFATSGGFFRALDGVGLDVRAKDTLAVVGESGCGKSVLGHALLRLLDDVATMRGSARLMGRDLFSLSRSEMLDIRGKTISLVPQSPSTAFNPVVKIGKQIRELVEKAGMERGKAAVRRVEHYLAKVGFGDPEAVYHTYPHRLSGGMCQMALIAMAVSAEPKLIIADEPTKGLDLRSRENILTLLHAMTADASMIMITHDFRAASTCRRIAVMYSGEIVEEGPTSEVLESPRHFYTRGLLDAHPSRGMKPIRDGDSAPTLAGDSGCRFRARCDAADARCEEYVPLRERDGGRKVRCHHG